IGIQPDMVVCRSESPLSSEIRKKIALFASLPIEAVVSAYDVKNIYECPLNFHSEGVDDFVLEHFGLSAPPPDLDGWRALTESASDATEVLRIAIVGKYVELEDAYLSVAEALRHAGFRHGCRIEIDWVDSEALTGGGAAVRLADPPALLIPGGVGSRGFEGKIEAARYAREHGMPYL